MNCSKIKLSAFALAILFLALCSESALSKNSQNHGPGSSLSVSDVDVGVVYSHSIIRADVVVRNRSGKHLDIARIVASTALSGTSGKAMSLNGNDEAIYSLEIDVGRRAGRFSIGYDIYLVGEAAPVSKFVVRGFADWIVDPASMKADIGIVAADKSARLELIPIPRPGASFRLKSVDSSSSVINVEVSSSGKSAIVSTKKSTKWGIFDEIVDIALDSALQPKVSDEINGEVRGQVVSSASIVNFGLVREGQSAEQTVRLTDETGAVIRLGKISSRGVQISVKDERCIPAEVSCRLLRLSPLNLKPGTVMRGEIVIQLPEYASELSLVTSGFVIGKDERVDSLNEDAKEKGSVSQPISKLLKSAAAKPVEMNIPEGDGPLLTWRVTGNNGIFGFEIYRGPSADGPFERATQSFIYPIAVNNDAGAIYRWRDQSVVPGRTYWYYIGLMYNDGRRQALTGAQKISVK